MPIYEYVCDSCSYGFERIQSFSDDPVAECPMCGGPVRRVISPVGVIFKGSGWYITDNRRHIAGAGQPSLADKSAKDEAPAGAEEAPGSRSDEKGDSNGKDSTAKGAARGDTGKKGSGKREPAGGSSGKTTSKGN